MLIRSSFVNIFVSNFFVCIVMKGISHKLMKASAKRRRSRAQIEEEKQ